MGFIEKIKALVVKKYALGYLVEAYKAVNGHKTQIVAALAVCSWVAARLGFIPPEQEGKIYEMLGGAGTITLLAKLEKWKNVADELGSEVKAEGGK